MNTPDRRQHQGAFGLASIWSLTFETFGRRYAMLLGAALLSLLIIMGAGIVTLVLDMVFVFTGFVRGIFFDIPFGVGVWYVALRCVRGEEARIEQLFVGFSRYWVVLGLGVVVNIATFLAMLPGFVLVGIGIVSLVNGSSQTLGIALLSVGAIVAAIGGGLVASRLWWATLLAIDPRAERPNFGACLEISWSMTAGRWPIVILLYLATAILTLLTFAILVLPWLFFTLPLVAAGSASVYHLLSKPIVRPPEGFCTACGYDIRGLEGNICPECGAMQANEQQPATATPPPADLY